VIWISKGYLLNLCFLKIYRKTGVKVMPWKIQSAVEPFLENEMSDANREQVTVLNSL
jgi:protease-4